MEGNSNWKPNEQGGYSLASNNANDWRSQLQPDMRTKIIFAIVERLKKHFPNHSQDYIKNVAFTFEDKIRGTSIDKGDYMRRIMNTIMNLDKNFRIGQSGSAVNGTNTRDNPAAQALNQGTSLPIYTQTPTSQQWLTQNNNQSNLNNIPESSGLPEQDSVTVSAARNLNIQMGEGIHLNFLPGPQQQQLLQQPQRSYYFPNQMDQQAQQQQPQSSYCFPNQMDHQAQHHQPSLLEQPIQQQLTHQTTLSNIHQSFPQSSVLSSLPSSGQQNSQFFSRHHQFPTQQVHSSHHQQQMAMPSHEQKRQEHEQLVSQLMNGQDTQQIHLTSLQNNGEQQGAFRISSSQQAANFQERAQQTNNIQNIHHQQPLYSHSYNASALPSQQQQYMPGGLSGNCNVYGSSLLGTQGQEVGQSQPQHPVQQQQQQPQKRILQQPLDDTQRFQPSDSTSKTVNASGDDWQEETCQKITALKENYSTALNTLLQMISDKLLEIDSAPQEKMQHESNAKLRASKSTLEHVLVFLNVDRSSISERHRDNFSLFEEQVLRFAKPLHTVTRRQQQQGPHSLQTRPNMEPKEKENNIMSSSGNVVLPSPASNVVHSNISLAHPSMFQQHQFHHLPMQHQLLQSQQQQPQTNHQQLQIPVSEMNDVRMRQGVNITSGLVQQHLSSSQRQLPKPQMSNVSPTASSSQFVDQQILPISSQSGGSLFVAPSLVTSFARSPNPGDPEMPITVESHVSPTASSPQFVDQQIIPTSLQSGGSPFVAPSLVTSFATSPKPGDPEMPISVDCHVSHGQEHPLFTLPPEQNAERHIEHLTKDFQSSSPEYLEQSVSEMWSVISMTDRLAGSVHSIEGSRAGLTEDLSGRTRFRVEQGETNPNKRFKLY